MPNERTPRSFQGGLYQLLRAPEAAYTAGFILTRKAEGVSARVLLMIRLPLTAFRMVPISSLLHCAPRKLKTLSNTYPDHNARLFLKNVRVLKSDVRKTLPKQAWYLLRVS